MSDRVHLKTVHTVMRPWHLPFKTSIRHCLSCGTFDIKSVTMFSQHVFFDYQQHWTWQNVHRFGPEKEQVPENVITGNQLKFVCIYGLFTKLYIIIIYISNIHYCGNQFCLTTQSFESHFSLNPYPTAFPYGSGMVLHFYQQQESSMTKTVHKVINKGLKAYV